VVCSAEIPLKNGFTVSIFKVIFGLLKTMNRLKSRLRVLPADRVPFLALIVAALSLIFSALQFAITQTRQMDHDKLSVRPLLMFQFNATYRGAYAGFLLKNKGIGPALIETLHVEYEGNTIYRWGDLNSVISKEALMFTDRQDLLVEMHFGGNYILAPNDEVPIFGIDEKTLWPPSDTRSATRWMAV
jgi:hypothetical protein